VPDEPIDGASAADRPRNRKGRLPTVRLLEVSSGSTATAYGTSVLASLGHEVWKVELGPTGDELRDQSPTVGDAEPVSVAFAHTASGKRHTWLPDLAAEDCLRVIDGWHASPPDPESSAGVFAEALRWADVLVTSFAPIATAAQSIARVVAVTPGGLGSGRNSWRLSGATLFHLSGLGIVTPRSAYHGEAEDYPPQAPWGRPLEYLCGLYVAFGALGLAHSPPHSLADISLVDCLLPLTRRESAAWQYEGRRASRRERLWKVGPSGFYECSDGYLYLHVVEDSQWSRLCQVIGALAMAEDPRLADASGRFAHEDEIDRVLGPWCQQRTRATVFNSLGAAGVPCGPAFSVSEASGFAAQIDARAARAGRHSWTTPLPIRTVGEELRWMGVDDAPELKSR
jgi:crotonobetainyl-CoA:carnitine CoA-transferase CaiB-like acyl-CoA transferase